MRRSMVLALAAGLLLGATPALPAARHATTHATGPTLPPGKDAGTLRPAAPAADTFQVAAAAYEAGHFAEAQAGWESLLTAPGGGRTPAICYNLGNAQFRLGHRGLAIVWYERARRLAPRDEDTRYNLVVARSSLQDEEPSGWETADRILTPNELAWVLGALTWILGFGCGWALWANWEWRRWKSLVIWGAPLLLLVALWLGLRTQDLAAPWAVTTQPTLEVRSGPGDQFAVGFTVPEGTRALVLKRRPAGAALHGDAPPNGGGWIELGVPAKSLKGWAPDDSVSLI